MRCFLLNWLAVVCGLLAGTGAARAQLLRPAPPDSARLSRRPHRLDEVHVRAVGPERFATGSRHYEADSATLSQYRDGTVAELLQDRTPLYIKSYGPGQLASISMRGTSAQQTAVLWNGLNIMLPTLGQNDFALLPVGANGRLAVQPGPAAALYGSGAIGGVVLLSTAPDWRPGLRGSVQADAGSFGLRGGSLDVSTASAAVAVRVVASYRQALNNYPYTTQEFGGPVRRLLAGAALRHQWSLAPEVALRVGPAGQLTASAWFTDTDREVQPAATGPSRRAEQLDQSRRLVLSYRHQASARAQWLVRAAAFEDVLNYHDISITSDSRVRTTQGQAEYTAAVGQRGSLRVGAEVQHFSTTFREYASPLTTENRAAAFALFRYDPQPRLRLTANLRQAALPQGNPLTPTAGLEWDVWTTGSSADSLTHSFTHSLTVKASAARSYRYTDASARAFLPGYGLLGGSVGYALRLHGAEALLLLQGTNLFNHAYESYDGRPAPARALAVSLRLSWL